MWCGANQRGSTDRPAGGSGTGAFVVDAPFSVTTTGGLNDGDTLTIDLLTGQYPPRQFGTGNPYLYDDVDHQWQNGVDLALYAGFTDGQAIPLGSSAAYRISNTSVPDKMGVWTSQPLRTAYQTHVYGTVNMSVNNGKSWLGGPTWPTAWGTRNNTSLYLSFWGMSVNPFSGTTVSNGAGTLSNKILRFSTAAEPGANDPLPGIDVWATESEAYTSNGNNSQPDTTNWRAGASGNAGLWQRHEFWRQSAAGPDQYSQAGQLLDGWSGVMGQGQIYKYRHASGLGGVYESCHPVDAIYSPANLPTAAWWDSQNFPGVLPFAYVNDTLFGYDDSGTGGGSLGNSYYISEVYQDPDLWRFELADSLTWDQGPTSVVNRELQGKWTRVSNTRCTVQVKRGQFGATQTGLALFLVNENDRQSARRVLHN